MIETRKGHEGGARHLLDTCLRAGEDTVRLSDVQKARHPHRREDILERRSVLLRGGQCPKVIGKCLRASLRRQRGEVYTYPPEEGLKKGLRIRAIQSSGGRQGPSVWMLTADE